MIALHEGEGVFMRKISLQPLDFNDELVSPVMFDDWHLSTPALSLLTDFKRALPSVIDAYASAAKTLEVMAQEHSHVKLVVDRQQHLVGLFAADTRVDEALLKRVAQGEKRQEVSVLDLMVPRSRLKAITYARLQQVSIGDLLHSLEQSGENYCLVVDEEAHQIRGLISVHEISQRLHQPVAIHASPSFLHLQALDAL